MRGRLENQVTILVSLTPDQLVPEDHPIRRIKPIVDQTSLAYLEIPLLLTLYIVPPTVFSEVTKLRINEATFNGIF